MGSHSCGKEAPHESGTRLRCGGDVSGGIDGVAGVISDDAVDHDFETEHGDPGNRRDGHEALGAMHSVGDAQRDGPDQSREKRNQKRAGESNSVALEVVPTGFGGEDGRRRCDTSEDPKAKE